MNATPTPSALRGVRARDVGTLRRLLNRLGRDEGTLAVVEVDRLRHRHCVMRQLAPVDGNPTPFEPAVVRCGPGVRPIRAGMRLRLRRDEAGAYLEQCIP